MKKILAIALAAVMVLGLATSALAVSWAAPATSTTASPFAVEVVKLGVNTDVTGGAYYTVLDDAAAYDYSTIYYAIKLSLPSYADANAYYGNSGFVNGGEVKVTITWTNVSGKSTQTVMVPLDSQAQTLWFDGKAFTSTWQQKISASCGCADSHIQSAIASGTKEVSVKVCVGAEGKLSDVTIGGCYGVKKETYYGIVPCVNCKPQNLSGYLFSGDCTAYDVFFATNSAAKVTGVYAVDKIHKDLYYGGIVEAFDKDFYAWKVTDSKAPCGTCNVIPTFTLEKLPYNAVLLDGGENGFVTLESSADVNVKWMGGFTNSSAASDAFAKWIADFKVENYKLEDLFKVYTKTNTTYKAAKGGYVGVGTENWAKNDYSEEGYTEDKTEDVKITSTLSGGIVDGSSAYLNPWTTDKTLFTGYKYNNDKPFVYKDTYKIEQAKSDARLFQQTSATTINCDTNEASYLNTLNHLYSLLGFTYADVAAGNVYMNNDILLANFGFSTSICDTATWGAYTAAITVAPVTEVPATGVASFAGFAMIAVAAAAAAVAKKRD